MISFLSPSSLMYAENMPHTFYLERIIRRYVFREEKDAFNLGNLTDINLKLKVIKRLGIEDSIRKRLNIKSDTPLKDFFMGQLNENLEISHFKSKVKKACNRYMDFMYDLRNITDVEKNLSGTWEDVPIYGKLDAVENNKIPLDWKTTSTSCPGKYFRIFDGVRIRAGNTKRIPIEDISYSWATQLATYGKLLNLEPPFNVCIDMISFKNRKPEIRLYNGVVTGKLFYSVKERYKEMWHSISKNNFEDRIISCDINDCFALSQDEVFYKKVY